MRMCIVVSVSCQYLCIVVCCCKCNFGCMCENGPLQGKRSFRSDNGQYPWPCGRPTFTPPFCKAHRHVWQLVVATQWGGHWAQTVKLPLIDPYTGLPLEKLGTPKGEGLNPIAGVQPTTKNLPSLPGDIPLFFFKEQIQNLVVKPPLHPLQLKHGTDIVFV